MKKEWKNHIYPTIVIIALIFNWYFSYTMGYTSGKNYMANKVLMNVLEK